MQRLEVGPSNNGEKIDPLACAILEPQVEGARPGSSLRRTRHFILLTSRIQRHDPPKSATCPRQVPVLFELFSVQLAPGSDESKRPWRQATFKKAETADR